MTGSEILDNNEKIFLGAVEDAKRALETFRAARAASSPADWERLASWRGKKLGDAAEYIEKRVTQDLHAVSKSLEGKR